jgi:hypothetical protein
MKFITGQSLTVGEMLVLGLGLGSCGLSGLAYPFLVPLTYVTFLFGFYGYVVWKRRGTPRPLVLSPPASRGEEAQPAP